MSLKTVKEELNTLSSLMVECSSKCNTVINCITVASEQTAGDVVIPATQLQMILATGSSFIEKANADFKEELEILLLDYSKELDSFHGEITGIVQTLGELISIAKDIQIYNMIADSLGISCPISVGEMKPYSAELQQFCNKSKKLSEESKKWFNELSR